MQLNCVSTKKKSQHVTVMWSLESTYRFSLCFPTYMHIVRRGEAQLIGMQLIVHCSVTVNNETELTYRGKTAMWGETYVQQHIGKIQLRCNYYVCMSMFYSGIGPAAAMHRVFCGCLGLFCRFLSFFCLIAMQVTFPSPGCKNNSRMKRKEPREEGEICVLYFTAEAYRSQSAMGHSIGVMTQCECVRESVCEIVGLP